MKQKKLIMIALSIIFIVSVGLYFLATREEKNIEKKDKAIAEEKKEVNSGESNMDWEESPFKYDSVTFHYHTEPNMIDVKALLDQNEQRHVLEYKLYSFLYEKGYKEIESVEIYGGKKIETEFVDFTATAITKKEKEDLELKIIYNTGLYSFGIHFIKDEYNATPVSIRNMDYDVENILRDKMETLEKEFGVFVFHEKLSAKTATITHYEMNDNLLSMQVELDDEYQTYCRIYYDTEREEFDFKKW